MGVGLLTPCFVLGRAFLYTMTVLGGGVFSPFESYPGGMVNDEIDSGISERLQNVHPGKVNYWVNDLPGFSMQLPWVHANRLSL